MKLVTDAGERAMHAAIVAIEGASSAELVITVRQHARRWLPAHVVAGVTAAIALLAYTLYSDREFALWEILALPIATGAIAALLVEIVAPLYRFLAPAEIRRAHVREAARAAFVERGVHATKKRTGILVYIAVRERMVELVGDVIAVRRLGQPMLERWATALARELPRGGEAFGNALAELAAPISRALPHHAGDTNELADDVDSVRPRKLRRVR